jgi:hypothetical protein
LLLKIFLDTHSHPSTDTIPHIVFETAIGLAGFGSRFSVLLFRLWRLHRVSERRFLEIFMIARRNIVCCGGSRRALRLFRHVAAMITGKNR